MDILLDCGAYTGDSLPTLIRLYGPFQRIVCFEANPNLSVEKPDCFDAEFEVHRLAVWHRNTNLRFYYGEHNKQSSVMDNKTTGNFSIDRSALVEAIDLADWIIKNTSTSDRLIVKMDIEGAEFDVLARLLMSSACKRIDHLLVEWHNNRLKPRWRYRYRRKIIELRYFLMGTPIRIWRTKSIPGLQ
jgi:FkbM family methyltransferase